MAVPEWIIPIIYQVPLAAAVGWMFISGKVHSDAELKRREKEFQEAMRTREAEHLAQIAYIEARRAEERADRLLAEQRIDRLTESAEKSEELMASIEKEIIRNGPR